MDIAELTQSAELTGLVELGTSYCQSEHVTKMKTKVNCDTYAGENGDRCCEAGKDFELFVRKEIIGAGFHIFGANLKKQKEIKGKAEIDILLYKTIIECKSVSLSYLSREKAVKEKNHLRKQIITFKRIFPDYKLIIWLKNANHSPETIFDDIDITNVYFIDNIAKLRQVYTEPTYYISDKFIIFTLISNLNKTSRHEQMYRRIYVKQEVLDKSSQLLNDIEEIQRFEQLAKQINIVDEYPENSLEVKKNNSCPEFDNMYCYQIKCYGLQSIKHGAIVC